MTYEPAIPELDPACSVRPVITPGWKSIDATLHCKQFGETRPLSQRPPFYLESVECARYFRLPKERICFESQALASDYNTMRG